MGPSLRWGDAHLFPLEIRLFRPAITLFRRKNHLFPRNNRKVIFRDLTD